MPDKFNKIDISDYIAQGIVSSNDINIFDPKQVLKLRKYLHHLSTNNGELYAKQAREFFIACSVPAEEVTENDLVKPDNGAAYYPNNVVKSFVNGQPMYKVKDTDMPEYEKIREGAISSAVLWDKLPVEARQEFFRILTKEISPKYKDAIDLAITLEVGKAGSEFSKLAEWDNWAASSAVNWQLTDIYMEDDKGRKFTADNIPDDVNLIFFYQGPEMQGGKINASTNGFNYPGALAMPDIAASRVSGNSLIAKVPSKAPAFLYMRKHAEHEALNLMAQRFAAGDYAWAKNAKENDVDLSDPGIVDSLKEGLGIISGRAVISQWAHDAKTFRLVGGGPAGNTYRPIRRHTDPDLEHTILELAGNNPLVIMPSAARLKGGLEAIIKENAEGNKNNSGQRCTSPRRWFIHADIYEEAKELAIAEYTKSATNEDEVIGNPLDPNTKVGAMDKGGFQAAQKYLEEARKAGAQVIGGNRVFSNEFPNAYYMTPALVIWDGVPEDKKELMHKQEIFAPIANLDRVSSLDQAISNTNESKEGLSGAFYCHEDDMPMLVKFSKKTDLGSLIHNGPPKDQSPWGIHAGRDHGGIGITGSLAMLAQYRYRVRTRHDEETDHDRQEPKLLTMVKGKSAALRFVESLKAQNGNKGHGLN